MCCSVAPAHFSETIVFIGVKVHPIHGLVHVLAYQNQASNLHFGPNAMVLHIPNGSRMGPDNFIDTRGCRNFLSEMKRTLFPPPPRRAILRGNPIIGARASGVQVFDHGSYTVVLADRPSEIPSALGRVPEEKRPTIRPKLFDFYEREFPDYTLALCCFDGRVRAEPMTLWYKPRNPGQVMWPALDSHTGNPPDIRAFVDTDHVLIAGADNLAPSPNDGAGFARPRPDLSSCGPWVDEFLPSKIVGRRFAGQMANGDFALNIDDLLVGNMGAIIRQSVPSLAAV